MISSVIEFSLIIIPELSTSTHNILLGFSVTSVTHNHPLQIWFESSIVEFSFVVWLTFECAPGPVSSSKSDKFQYCLRLWLSTTFLLLLLSLLSLTSNPNISLPLNCSYPSSTICCYLGNSSPSFPYRANLHPSFIIFINYKVSNLQWCFLWLQRVCCFLVTEKMKQHSILTFNAWNLDEMSIFL